MVPLLVDHDVTDVIIDGIILHHREVDLIRAKHVGLQEVDDDVLLEWAAAHYRLVISSDEKTMVPAAHHRLRSGLPMLGLIIVRQSLDFRTAIEDLAAIAVCSELSEWVNTVEYLPLVK